MTDAVYQGWEDLQPPPTPPPPPPPAGARPERTGGGDGPPPGSTPPGPAPPGPRRSLDELLAREDLSEDLLGPDVEREAVRQVEGHGDDAGQDALQDATMDGVPGETVQNED